MKYEVAAAASATMASAPERLYEATVRSFADRMGLVS